MAISTYNPSVTVGLTKVVNRTSGGVSARFTAADINLDLTPYLGETGSVRTSKSLAEPTGTFEIAFGDWLEPNSNDTVYSHVEPMDMIFIRGARHPEEYNGTLLPLIMRGFVSSVRRSESIGDDGKPRRAVVITGHDMGKLTEIHQVLWEQALNQEKPLLTAFGLQAALGLTPELVGVAQFMSTFVQKVLNVKVAELETFSNLTIRHFIFEDGGVKQGQVSPAQFGSIMAGTYWQLISGFADRPWNELFIVDHEDGPHIVFREVPYKDIDGKLIMPYATDPGTIELNDNELVQLDVMRSDSRVANFFWTPPGTSSLDTNGLAVAGSIQDGSALDFNYFNNRPELYGERKMEAGTALIPTEADGLLSKLPPNEQAPEGTKYIQWYRLRAQQLQALNRDNVVFEDGTMTVMGRETYVIGHYLRLYRGDITSDAYITAVSHTFQPLSGWTTTLRIERGTGFLQRIKLTNSPMLAELRPGPYST